MSRRDRTGIKPVDVAFDLSRGYLALATNLRSRPARVGPVMTLLSAPKPPKKKSHAADRTRSKRWRAGTRRNRKYPARPPTAEPMAQLGDALVPAAG